MPATVAAALKRMIDVVVAALALLVLAPLFGLIALLIVLDSPGPVFYRAERTGHRGRPLRMLKFRKMAADAAGSTVTTADDARLTRLGRMLVASKLDELPQLWHVLRGDMSLVGPRPETPDHVALHPGAYAEILQMRPGLTGFTQLAFAREGSILDRTDPDTHYVTSLLPQKMALDRLYATRWTLGCDLRIMLATLVTLVLRLPIAVDRATGRLTLRRRPAVTGATRRAVARADVRGRS